MAVRIALRTTGKKIKPYVTTAGYGKNSEHMKKLQAHPKVQAAQDCIRKNASKGKVAVSKCMQNL